MYNIIKINEVDKKIICSGLKSKPKRISIDKINPLQIDFEVQKTYNCLTEKDRDNLISQTKHKFTEYYHDKLDNKLYCGIKK